MDDYEYWLMLQKALEQPKNIVKKETENWIFVVGAVLLVMMFLGVWEAHQNIQDVVIAFKQVGEQADLWKINESKRPQCAEVIVRDLVPVQASVPVNVLPSPTKKRYLRKKSSYNKSAHGPSSISRR